MIAAAISLIRPGITFGPGGSCQLIDRSNGQGPQIVEWTDPRPQPTQAEIDAAIPMAEQAALVAQYEQALTEHLDAKARERRYDSRITCALRAGFPGPFHAEGTAFAQWMDNCNSYAYQVLADVQAGNRTLPSVEAFIAELPDLIWP